MNISKYVLQHGKQFGVLNFSKYQILLSSQYDYSVHKTYIQNTNLQRRSVSLNIFNMVAH